MADPLFDISRHDLSIEFITPSKLDDLLPQCGDMRQVDRVAWIDDDATRAIGVKSVRNDEFWVPGHIPERPLLPGVIMIEAAAQLSSVLYQYRQNFEHSEFLGLTRVDDCVLRGTVEPGQTLVLLAKEKKFQRRRFSCHAQGLVDGNVVFEVQCTGMRM
jgi:3-hydroxyacyl-[acyl-carrier-protein] dehydratase